MEEHPFPIVALSLDIVLCYNTNSKSNGRINLMLVERKYNPMNYEASLGESMERAYDLAENDGDKCSLFSAIEDVYFFTKEAVKFKEIDPATGTDIQTFFWGLYND